MRSTRADGRPTRPYAETYDPFVALSAVAAVTTSITIGTSVCLLTQRDPIVTAKEVACLDRLSGGRFVFGVGAGWNRMELANHGTNPRTRMKLLAERVQAMRQIWTTDEAEYHGRFVDFDPIWSWPKPLRKPHPPVLVGGNGPGTEDRVLAFGDGWLPQFGGLASVDELTRRAAALRQRAADLGRGPIPITVFNVPPDPESLAALADGGIDRCLILLQAGTESELLRQLDAWAPLAAGQWGSG
ncbi:MAG TPA: LLM class F420-dependent oxidoreductase [Natronosporangium sp.]